MLRFVDHLVYSTPDLDEGIHLVEQLFGTDVTPGGRHENWGTRNALVSLGESTYLEIISPDPTPPT
ncbi:MAG: VOC family protein [Actinomycetota bacterium]|nr:VOC family protein [Actinomycetota bacterium]